MKDKRFITVVAIILCLTLILGNGFPSLASDEKGEGTQTEGQTAEPTETPAVNDVTAPESLPVVTETPEPTETPEGTEALLAVSEPVTPVPSQTPDADGTPDTSNGTPAVDPGPTPDAEEKNSDPEPSPTPSELPVSPDAQTDIPSEVDKEEVLQGFEAAYTDEDVNIEVTALPGVLPKDAVLKVVPVIWQEIPEEAEEEERSRLEEINSKYELTRSKLEESVAEQEDTIMVGFKAYDISFCITNEETGEESEIEPVGDVSVKMNFSNPIVPEEAAGSEDQEDPESPENQPAPMILDDSEALPEIRPAVKHLKEDENAEGGVSLIDITEQSAVEVEDSGAITDVAFVSDSFSVFATALLASGVQPAAAGYNNFSNLRFYNYKDINNSNRSQISEYYSGNRPFLRIQQGQTLSNLEAIGSALVTEGNKAFGSGLNGPYGELKAVTTKNGTRVQQLRYVRSGSSYKFQYTTNGSTWSNLSNNDSDDRLHFYFQVPDHIDTGSGDERPLPGYEPVEHNKRIDYLGDGNPNPDTRLADEDSYRLYLDILGIPKQESEPVDVILLLDRSGSMVNNKMEDDRSRLQHLQDAAKAAVNTFMTEGRKNPNRMSIITFSNEAKEYVSFTETSLQNKETLCQIIDGEYRGKNIWENKSGTNYQAGLQEAKRVIDEDQSGRKKYVIFVTDGQPTFYYGPSGTTIHGYGSDWDDQTKYWSKYAAAQITGISGFYSVGIGDSGYKTYLTELGNLVGATERMYLSGNNTTQLEETFAAIVSSITKQISHVTITDTLSGYVDFVKTTGSRPQATRDSIGLVVTRQGPEDPGPVTLDPNLYRIEISGKTINLIFDEDYFLESGTRYTMSFNVKLTELAYETPLKDTGDPDTDYDLINPVSSGRLGLYSNTTAQVRYRETIKTDQGYAYQNMAEDYQKPVVAANEGKFRVQKYIDNYREDLADDEFMIQILGPADNPVKMGAVLQAVNGKGTASPVIKVSKTTRFQIAETVPKEYEKSDTYLVVKDARTNQEVSGRISGDGSYVTVQPGDDLIVEVHNSFEHTGYFHNTDSVFNLFKAYRGNS
ncbi:vWA domain-containing protein [Diplocloster modestus]|uniref:VWA domain-containing protein n=1 Tax=Diplocloster modestus TaxID=2850322 RepID=A0ABS6K7N7_9FIRM|nr:vWA domain-containing protein [Diplocloster modestus]MBU9726529.1 VWA domain-containing protein [Diplocloster modestus]